MLIPGPEAARQHGEARRRSSRSRARVRSKMLAAGARRPRPASSRWPGGSRAAREGRLRIAEHGGGSSRREARDAAASQRSRSRPRVARDEQGTTWRPRAGNRDEPPRDAFHAVRRRILAPHEGHLEGLGRPIGDQRPRLRGEGSAPRTAMRRKATETERRRRETIPSETTSRASSTSREGCGVRGRERGAVRGRDRSEQQGLGAVSGSNGGGRRARRVQEAGSKFGVGGRPPLPLGRGHRVRGRDELTRSDRRRGSRTSPWCAQTRGRRPPPG